MAGPKNASLSAGGFRFYEWQEEGQEPVKLLSVTSIRKLCGEPFTLVNWQLNNIINVAMGTTKRVKRGPRGGLSNSYVLDGEFPGAFATRLAATEGKQAGLDSTRAWLREMADRPRDTAAVRGTIVHEALEIGATTDKIDRTYVEHAVGRLSPRDQKKMKSGITDEDVTFIRDCVANYWDMRVNVPYVLIAREPQVYSLSAGFGGSADNLLWFLGTINANNEFVPLPGIGPKEIAKYQQLADKKLVDLRLIKDVGGHVALGDYKTSAGVYTDHCLQITGYMAGEFIGADSIRDERLTELLVASNEGALIHIRPGGWGVDFIDFRPDVLRAFLGSVALARFLAAHEKPFDLFTRRLKGKATDVVTEEDIDGDD